MTRVLLFVDRPMVTYVWYHDPRPCREVMRLVNTHKLRFGLDFVPFDSRDQTAISIPEEGLVSVAFTEPYVNLTEQQYQVVFALVDGCPPIEIARRSAISQQRLPKILEELCACFQVSHSSLIVAQAQIYGLI